MSVLSFPRIYFDGYMGWDPPTANNNDYIPIYDGPNAGLDWDYLNSQGITRENFTTAFRPWAIQGHSDSCNTSPGAPTIDTSTDCGPQSPPLDDCHMGSRWDYFGGGGCWLVDYPEGGKQTLTTGGDLAWSQPSTGDPIIDQPVRITGNTFGGQQSHARLVDVNPESPWSSQIIFGSLKVGDDQTFIGGPQYLRMHSRLFFVPRCLDSSLIIAGAIGVIFQTTIPFGQLNYNVGGSSLLKALVSRMQQTGAQGLMLRFSAFNTLYYQNGVYNDTPQQPKTADELEAMYKSGQVFRNPAYSRIAGVFGVWNEGELSTMPGGHLLVPNVPVAPTSAGQEASLRHFAVADVPGHGAVQLVEMIIPNPNAAPNAVAAGKVSSGPPAMPMGPVLVEIDGANNLLSLDLTNAILEASADGTKFDFGTINVGVLMVNGDFNQIASFDYSQYNRESYIAKAGIVDVPFQEGVTWTQVQTWLEADRSLLALQAQGQFASLERPLVAETDSRGVYLDQCRTTQLTVQVRYRNGAPPAGTQVLLAQYYPWTLNVGAGQWALFGAPPPSATSPPNVCNATPEAPYLNFVGGDVVPVTIPEVNGQPAPYGEATVTLGHNLPGFPVVAFYPFLSTDPTPTPQPQVTFGFTNYKTYTIGNAHYTTVRAMAADNGLLQEFVDRWNGTGSYAGQPPYDRLLTWQFVYSNILYVYDMLYPVMEQFMPLGQLEAVEAAVDQLVTMISEDWVDLSTLYMPVTRELSAAKRLILLTWGDLVGRKYPQEALQPLSVPCDES